MKSDRLILFFAVLSLGLLSACNSVQSELVLEPVRLGTKTMARADRVGACFGLDRSVIAPSRLALAAGEVGAGYENAFIRGADPAPCNLRRNYAHQGAVLFDLSELTRRRAVVLEATLEATVREPVFPDGVVINMRLNLAGQDWESGNFTGAINTSDPRAQIPILPLPSRDESYALGGVVHNGVTSSGLSAIVTRTVQNWNQNTPRTANHGFVFAALPEHLFAEENQNLIVIYSNIRLRLKILEPRAP